MAARTARRLLLGLLEIARKQGVILVNPIHDVPTIRGTRRDVESAGVDKPRRVLSADEERALVDAIWSGSRFVVVSR